MPVRRGALLNGPLLQFSSLLLVVWLLAGCGGSMNSSSGGNPNPTPTQSSINVVTYHYDNMRTGANTNETLLTPANVNSIKFGQLGAFIVDGKVDAQPLYLSNLSIPGVGMRNVLYIVTEHGSVFAFDADSVNGETGKPLWMTPTQSLGEVPSDDRGCDQVTPEIGITFNTRYRSRSRRHLLSRSLERRCRELFSSPPCT